MSTLLDTNILLRRLESNHPMHQEAEDSVALLRQQGEVLRLVPQNIYELWVVCTRPTSQNGLGMSAGAAAAELSSLKQLFTVIDDTPAIFPEWERLVTQHQILGKNAHDARLIAAMNVHGIGRILTFNIQDFGRYPGIVALSPHDVIQGQPPSTP